MESAIIQTILHISLQFFFSLKALFDFLFMDFKKYNQKLNKVDKFIFYMGKC